MDGHLTTVVGSAAVAIVVFAFVAFYTGMQYGKSKKRKSEPDQPVEIATSDGYKSISWGGQCWYSEGAVYYKSKKQNAQLHERVAELVLQMGDNARKNSVDLAIESGARGSAVVEVAGQIYSYLLKKSA